MRSSFGFTTTTQGSSATLIDLAIARGECIGSSFDPPEMERSINRPHKVGFGLQTMLLYFWKRSLQRNAFIELKLSGIVQL
jgi:hypothetical protein